MQNITPAAVYSKLYRTLCRFKRLSYVDWKDFIDRTTIASFKANELVEEAGTLSTHSYFIISGLMMCYDEQNTKQANWFRAEGTHAFTLDKFRYGEVGNSNHETIMALEDTLVVSFSHEDYKWLRDHYSDVGVAISGLLLVLGRMMCRTTSWMIVDARERYEWLEGQLGFKLERIPDEYLAPYTRITLKRLKEIRKTRPVSFLSRY